MALDSGDPRVKEFLAEMRAIQDKELDWGDRQIDRLMRPGHQFFNLVPHEVLKVPLDATPVDVKKAYRRLSVLVHPDKNANDPRAQAATAALNEAYEMTQDEKAWGRCQRVVEEARRRLEHELGDKTRRKLVEEDPAKLEHMVRLRVIMLFAELESKRQAEQRREQEEKKRKHEDELDRNERLRQRLEAMKDWDEARPERVDSWRQFQAGQKKKKQKKQKKDGDGVGS